MTDNSKIEHWVKIADYDLKTADAMLETKRFLYVGFMCHLVIEKLLKAYFVKISKVDPPYTHNLLFLAEKTNLINLLEEQQKDFLDILQPFNVRARYPVEKDSLFKILDLDKSKEIITKTKQLAEWIKNKL